MQHMLQSGITRQHQTIQAQVQNGIHNYLCWMPYALDIKDANWNSTIHYRGRVHSTFTVHERGITYYMAKVHCKVFEDNAGAIEIANVPKMRPRTKNLNIKYHHFREEVRKGTVSIYYTWVEDQIADIFTKPLPETSFIKFREKIMGW